MQRHPLLIQLMRSPWALLEEYRPLLAGVFARLLSGGRLDAAGLEAVHRDRREFDARHGVPATPQAREEGPYQRVRGANGSKGDVAVIPIYGVIAQRGGVDMDTSEPLASAQRVAQSVQMAASDPQIGGIVLDVDSPGGSVYGVSELGDAIYSARQAKPIAAVCNSLMASAAYWAASQAGEVYCAPGGEVGSIGVYTIHCDISEALKQAGVAMTLISAGRYKTEGNSYGPLDGEALAFTQSAVDGYYQAFVKAVARGRGTTQKAVREGMGQGRVLQADAAKSENMIDGVATLAQVVARMQARAEGRDRSAAGMRAYVAQQLADGQVQASRTPPPLITCKLSTPTGPLSRRAAIQRELELLELS